MNLGTGDEGDEEQSGAGDDELMIDNLETGLSRCHPRAQKQSHHPSAYVSRVFLEKRDEKVLFASQILAALVSRSSSMRETTCNRRKKGGVLHASHVSLGGTH